MKSYNIKDLQALANETGFIRDNLEKVIRITDILAFLSRSETVNRQLALKGGTSINLTVFEMPRLSVDADFDFDARTTRDEMLERRNTINLEIQSFMQSEGYALRPDSRNPHSLDSWVFGYVNAGGNRDNIKIEINYSMRQHILPLETRHPTIAFLAGIPILSVATTEIFAGKIKALIERTAARDLFDVYNLLHSPILNSIDTNLLRKCALFYTAVGGSRAPQEECDLSAIDDLQFKQIRAQLLPMLHRSEYFDFQQAKTEVKIRLSDLLKFTDSEREFIRAFNRKEYRPDLLFNDRDIIARISDHPMALWKTR